MKSHLITFNWWSQLMIKNELQNSLFCPWWWSHLQPSLLLLHLYAEDKHYTKQKEKKKRKQRGDEHFVRWVNWVFGPKQVPFIRPFLPVGLSKRRSFFCPGPAVCYCDTGLCHPCACIPPTSSSFITAEWFLGLTEGDKDAPRPTVDTAGPSRRKCPDQSKAPLGQTALLVSVSRKQDFNLTDEYKNNNLPPSTLLLISVVVDILASSTLLLCMALCGRQLLLHFEHDN